jgi:hypothetical protein
MAYYDRIAKQWHEATGYKGGAFKELVLNGVLLRRIPNDGSAQRQIRLAEGRESSLSLGS